MYFIRVGSHYVNQADVEKVPSTIHITFHHLLFVSLYFDFNLLCFFSFFFIIW